MGCHLLGIELLESGPMLSPIIPVGSYLIYLHDIWGHGYEHRPVFLSGVCYGAPTTIRAMHYRYELITQLFSDSMFRHAVKAIHGAKCCTS